MYRYLISQIQTKYIHIDYNANEVQTSGQALQQDPGNNTKTLKRNYWKGFCNGQTHE